MDGYDASTYGERIAPLYDSWYPEASHHMIDRLAQLAGKGPVLELGIGTGRVALPLAERDLEVHGIDASPAMVERLRAKPGGEGIEVTIGDFSDFSLGSRFSLIFVVFNTFFGLLTRESQLACFERVADHLMPEGRLLLECFVPDPSRFDRHQRLETRTVEQDQVVVVASRHDSVNQRVDSHYVVLGGGGVELYPGAVRYAWPSELDLMARLAGLRLEHRWGGWAQEAFAGDSDSHISVYRPD